MSFTITRLAAFCITDAHLTFFPHERGVRQGCPLSGLLFDIGIELVSSTLQKDPTIKGIRVGQKDWNKNYAVSAEDTGKVLVGDLEIDFEVTEGLPQIWEY